LYISQKLFDNDNEIEFLYIDQLGTSSCVTQVVNEDGSIIFTEYNAGPLVKGNAPQAQLPIYNTVAGTKMILSLLGGTANVYGLPGTLSAVTVKNIDNPISESVLFPNPSNKSITVEDEKYPINRISIFDLNGKLIENIKVDNKSNYELDISSLSVGEYIIQTTDKNGKVTGNKKLIKN